MYTPGVGVVWGSMCTILADPVCYTLLPTKTSQLWIHSSGRSKYFFRASSQVASTSWVTGISFLLMTVAIILSSVSRLFIALNHLNSASSGECSTSWITLSHLRTQIRCAASDISIWRSRVAPLCLRVGLAFHASWSPVLATRHPHPRMVPISMSGHWMSLCGHISFAMFQMAFAGPALQFSSMCSIFSVLLHGVHSPLSWNPWILNHTSPTIGVLWIALYRNCWTCNRMERLLIPCQIVSSVSSEPE